jgi:hypothetical protein
MAAMKKPFLIANASILITLLGMGQTLGANPNTLGITISPPSFSINANPGDRLNDTIRVTNDSPGDVTLQVAVHDFTVTGTEGSVAVLNKSQPTSTSNWFSFPVTQVKLAAKASQNVAFSINVPKNAEPGGHYASILFNPVRGGASPQTGASVVQRVGSLVLLTISGAIVDQGNIVDFHAKNFVGTYSSVLGSDNKTHFLLAQSEALKDEHPAFYFNQGPVAFDVVFKNTGNVHFQPTGTVAIYDLFGQKVYQTPLDPRNVFPGGERRITVIWPQKSLWGIYYHAKVSSVYGPQNTVLIAETGFWAFPFYVLLIILAVIVLLFLMRRRLAIAFNALIKGH